MSDISQMPNVNQPSSGTYGEGAELSRLKQSLPPMPKPQPPTSAPQANIVPIKPDEARTPADVPGIPYPMFAPTKEPGVPVNTPLSTPAGPQGGAVGRAQQQLAAYDQILNNPNVSPQTKSLMRLAIQRATGADR